MEIKAAIFDLDGTLIDSMPYWQNVGGDYIKSRGGTPERDLDRKFEKMTVVESAEFIKQNYLPDESVEEIANGITNAIEGAYINTIPLKEGCLEFLSALKENGVHLAVATVSSKALAEAVLSRCGVLEFFDGIASCAELNTNKSTSPLVYEKALEITGQKKENSIIFEDAAHGIKTALAANFRVAGIFDKTSQHNAKELKEICNYYFYDWHSAKQALI